MESNMKRVVLVLIGLSFATVGVGCCGTGPRPFSAAYNTSVSYPTYAVQSYATPTAYSAQAIAPYQTTAAVGCNCAPN